MTNDPTMPFGKHRGTQVSGLPNGYLIWLTTQTDLYGYLKDAVEREGNERLADA